MAKHFWIRVTPEFLNDLRVTRYSDIADMIETELPHYEWREGGMRLLSVPEVEPGYASIWDGQEPKECSF